jgi:hypothetical protein
MRYKPTNHNGEYGMTGIFLEVKDDLRTEIKGLNDKMHVSVNLFSKIVNRYIQEVFKEVIQNGKVFSLHNRLGRLIVVKSKCIRYNPTKVYFVTENGKKVRKTQKIETINGRWAYLFWDVGKKWRMYRFKPAPKFKKQITENFMKGFDYPEMDLQDYGRSASPTYIQHLK